MYIRTKDGVYKVSHYNDWATHKRKGATLIDGDKTSYIKNENIISQSETIEGLCDQIVYNGYLYQVTLLNNRLIEDSFEELDEPITDEMIKEGIYGAIWTSKGLIYVAKMNEKGELCLL